MAQASTPVRCEWHSGQTRRSQSDRLTLAFGITSTVSRCDECRPSEIWLGLRFPKDRIRRSGLWLVNEFYKEPLARRDLQLLDSSLALARPHGRQGAGCSQQRDGLEGLWERFETGFRFDPLS
jgi:hypothetical protein